MKLTSNVTCFNEEADSENFPTTMQVVINEELASRILSLEKTAIECNATWIQVCESQSEWAGSDTEGHYLEVTKGFFRFTCIPKYQGDDMTCKSESFSVDDIRSIGDPLPPVRNEREFVIYAGADGKDREIHVVTETNTLRQAVNKVVLDLARNEEEGTTIFVDLAIESIPNADFYADEIHELSSQKEYQFNYMMLGRLQMDVEYYYGHGGRNAKHLYYDTIEEQIEEMKKLYNKFPDDIKPDWISMEEIEGYSREEVIGPMYAIIINCIGSKSISYDEQEDGTLIPTLFEKQWEALKDVDDCMNEGVDVSDWSVEKVTVQGDMITLVDTGETFDWKKSIS